mmetsp:Transcript_14545/g.39858  ORF Transcript_14545/g.39858 Transcript_14545/m.39858 type:complete len:253 (+) Transcript_14545:558-1316(+)
MGRGRQQAAHLRLLWHRGRLEAGVRRPLRAGAARPVPRPSPAGHHVGWHAHSSSCRAHGRRGRPDRWPHEEPAAQRQARDAPEPRRGRRPLDCEARGRGEIHQAGQPGVCGDDVAPAAGDLVGLRRVHGRREVQGHTGRASQVPRALPRAWLLRLCRDRGIRLLLPPEEDAGLAGAHRRFRDERLAFYRASGSGAPGSSRSPSRASPVASAGDSAAGALGVSRVRRAQQRGAAGMQQLRPCASKRRGPAARS